MASLTKNKTEINELSSKEEIENKNSEETIKEEIIKQQLLREEELRIPKGIVYITFEEAMEVCNNFDKQLGLPNENMTRWTEPIELKDGWLVQPPDHDGEIIDLSRIKQSIDVLNAELKL